MKILLVHNTYQRPGGEDVVFDQEHELLKSRGHHVIVYRRSNWEVEAYRGIQRISLAKKAIWASDTRREFVRLLRDEKPDVVHIHNTFVLISPSVYSACYEAGIPVVQTLHNYRLLCPAAILFRNGSLCEECLDFSLWRGVRHGCYHDSRSATAVIALMLATHRLRDTWNREISSFIALSNFARQKFIEGGLPAQKIVVKPNFVHPDPGTRTEDGEYALFVGRLSPEKRVSTVLAAWKRLRADVPIVVIGSGPEQNQLEVQAVADGLRNVHFRGHLPRERTLEAMKRARFLVFSSEWYENCPMTLAESFACGTPVISSGIGAMKEMVSHGSTGFHFVPGDSEDLAQKVEWAWNHPDEMRKMGNEARREYESKYTAEANYPMLMKIYEDAISPS